MGRLKLIRRLGTHQRYAILRPPPASKNIMTSGKFLPVKMQTKGQDWPALPVCGSSLVSAAPKWCGGLKAKGFKASCQHLYNSPERIRAGLSVFPFLEIWQWLFILFSNM